MNQVNRIQNWDIQRLLASSKNLSYSKNLHISFPSFVRLSILKLRDAADGRVEAMYGGATRQIRTTAQIDISAIQSSKREQTLLPLYFWRELFINVYHRRCNTVPSRDQTTQDTVRHAKTRAKHCNSNVTGFHAARFHFSLYNCDTLCEYVYVVATCMLVNVTNCWTYV